MTDQAVTETLDNPAPVTDPTKTDPAKAIAKTVLDDPGDKVVAAPADWPEDWRTKLADGDEKAMKQLERYQSPKDVAKALREAQTKISKGTQAFALPADATEEQVTAWRKENGIPEKPEGYLEKLPSGLVVGEDDKPLVDTFLTDMHKANVKPEVVGAALDWYYRTQEESAAEQSREDVEFKKASEDALRSDWGPEYRANINAISAFLDAAPSEGDVSLKALLMGARLADGTPLGSNPMALRWLAGMANEANPAGFVSPATGATQIKSVTDEIGEIETFMRENRAAYNKDGAKQARLRQLYEAEEKLSKRA
jgi:hypothetical protein